MIINLCFVILIVQNESYFNEYTLPAVLKSNKYPSNYLGQRKVLDAKFIMLL